MYVHKNYFIKLWEIVANEITGYTDILGKHFVVSYYAKDTMVL